MANKKKDLATKKKEEQAKKAAAAATKPVEEKKEDKTPAEEKEDKKPTATEAPTTVKETKKEDKKSSSNKPAPIAKKEEEVIIPEEVKKDEPKKDDDIAPVPSIARGLQKIADGDRIDANHKIDLMKMVHQEYVTNPETPVQLRQAMKKQFDVMALMSLMQYNAQLEDDFMSQGVRVNNTMAVQMEKVARETLGITLKGLPAPDDPSQMVINFTESIPADIKKEVKKDVAAAKIEIPEPDPQADDKSKLAVLRAIFAKQNGGGIGSNIINGLDWARKAFSFSETERKSVIFANILEKGVEGTLIRGLRTMPMGKMNSEHSPIGVHALLKTWLPTLPDQEIAEIAQVAMAYGIEKKTSDWNEKAPDDRKTTLEKELDWLNSDILAGCANEVIDAILNKKEEIIVKNPKKSFDTRVDTDAIRKSLISAYGDSDSILKDKLNEIVKYYVKPIMRLSNYVDKSAYADPEPAK